MPTHPGPAQQAHSTLCLWPHGGGQRLDDPCCPRVCAYGPPKVQAAQILSQVTPAPSPQSLRTWSQAGAAPPRTRERGWEIPNWISRAPILFILSHELKVSNSLRPEKEIKDISCCRYFMLPTIHKILILSSEEIETQNLGVLLKDI